MPVVEMTPPVTASPWTWVSRFSSFQLTPGCARTVLFVRIDVDPFHARQVDRQAAIGQGPAGHAVATAPN